MNQVFGSCDVLASWIHWFMASIALSNFPSFKKFEAVCRTFFCPKPLAMVITNTNKKAAFFIWFILESFIILREFLEVKIYNFGYSILIKRKLIFVFQFFFFSFSFLIQIICFWRISIIWCFIYYPQFRFFFYIYLCNCRYGITVIQFD